MFMLERGSQKKDALEVRRIWEGGRKPEKGGGEQKVFTRWFGGEILSTIGAGSGGCHVKRRARWGRIELD
jgi:hypothetical protein